MKNDIMSQYLTLVRALIPRFSKFEVAKVLRETNKMVDSLTNLVFNALYPCHKELNFMSHPSISQKIVHSIEARRVDSWITPLASYLRHGILPSNKKAANKLRAQVARYALINDTRRSFSGPYQRYVPP